MTLRKRVARQDTDSDDGDYEEEDLCNDSESRSKNDEPFWLTFTKVGITLAVLSSIVYSAFWYQTTVVIPMRRKQQRAIHRIKKLTNQTYADEIERQNEKGLDELPSLSLDQDGLDEDVFGVAKKYFSTNSSTKTIAKSKSPLFLRTAHLLQADFADRYGGIRSSRYLLQNSLYTVDDVAWTQRLWEKTTTATATTETAGIGKNKELFHVLVLGEGSVAGYGNYQQEAFSSVLEWTLEKAFSELGMEIRVTNAALEHVSMFPYMWCLEEFVNVDDDVDMVYVDFGVLTPTDTELLVRSILSLNMQQAPLFVLWDTRKNEERIEVMRHYIEMGLLQEPLYVHWKNAVKPFLEVKPSKRPPSLQRWSQYGNIHNIDKSLWTAAQHELMGGLLSMFLLKHLQLVVAKELGLYDFPARKENVEDAVSREYLPYPMLAKASQLKMPWSDLLYFADKHPHYHNAKLHCRTSFDPADTLEQLIVGGHVEGDFVNIRYPKGGMFYNRGWVMDIEASERREKKLSEHLGFKDTQKTYNGIPQSGKLELSLPTSTKPLLLIVCESLAPPQTGGCSLLKDVTFSFGEENATSVKRIETDSVSYKGKQLCAMVDIPESVHVEDEHLSFAIQVTNDRVTLQKGPCSIAHILWLEEREGHQHR